MPVDQEVGAVRSIVEREIGHRPIRIDSILREIRCAQPHCDLPDAGTDGAHVAFRQAEGIWRPYDELQRR